MAGPEGRRLIERLRAETGTAVLMVSHDLHVVMSASDRVICLNGHVCCEGAPSHVSSAPEYRALFGLGTGGALALYRHDHDHSHDHDGHDHHGHDHRPVAAEEGEEPTTFCIQPIVPVLRAGVVDCDGGDDLGISTFQDHVVGVVGENGFTAENCTAADGRP